MKIANRYLVKFLGTRITNENLILEEIKRRLNLGNACYHSVQNLLSSSLFCKNQNLQNYNLPLVLYESETWSLTLRRKID
jgi:hypothetical protein